MDLSFARRSPRSQVQRRRRREHAREHRQLVSTYPSSSRFPRSQRNRMTVAHHRVAHAVAFQPELVNHAAVEPPGGFLKMQPALSDSTAGSPCASRCTP